MSTATAAITQLAEQQQEMYKAVCGVSGCMKTTYIKACHDRGMITNYGCEFSDHARIYPSLLDYSGEMNMSYAIKMGMEWQKNVLSEYSLEQAKDQLLRACELLKPLILDKSQLIVVCWSGSLLELRKRIDERDSRADDIFKYYLNEQNQLFIEFARAFKATLIEIEINETTLFQNLKTDIDRFFNFHKIFFLKLSTDAISPVRASLEAAGVDLFALNTIRVRPSVPTVIRTGIAVELPEGCYGRIAECSGLVRNRLAQVRGGVIDRDYRGEIMVIIHNLSTRALIFSRGCKVAQLICERVMIPPMVELLQLSRTGRGASGFGSKDG